MATPINWYKKYSFIVEVDGVARAAFTTCSELRIKIDTVAYREGGRLHAHKSPGLVEFPPITLGRGVTDDFDLYSWIRDSYDAAAGTGMVTPDLYRTLDIVQLDRDGSEKERYRVYAAYAAEYAAGDWDNNSNETRMEELVFECDYWERVPS